MPENIPIQPEVPEESKFEKYAPIVKSLAAIGVGLAGNSGMSRGIATGLAASAKEDVRIKQILDDERRKQTERDIKARQDQLKLQFDTMYKVYDSIDDPKAKHLYAEQVGLNTIGKEYVGSQFELPAVSPDAEPAIFDIDMYKQAIDSEQDPDVKAQASFYYHNAIKNQGKAEGRISFERMIDVLQPKGESYYQDGSNTPGFFKSKEAAERAGYIFDTPQGSKDKDATDDQKITVNSLISDANKTANKIQSDMNKIDDGWLDPTFDLRGMLRTNAEQQKKLLGGTRIGDFNPLRVSSPIAGYIEGSYEIIAATQVLEKVDQELLDAGGTADDLPSTPDAVKRVLRLKRADILQIAEDLRAADEDRDPVDVTKTMEADKQEGTTLQGGDRISVQVQDLQGVDKSMKPEVVKRLKDAGYTPSEIKAIISKLGW